ncbi:hypothetical protein BJ508DRAFT_416901 [Ascobolus immersus RN42]|uniref:Uncharacterized protein n=1 Tax=Ascobolus immersus RN42 TaxID=1160509 RepID=A0A3N4HX31_ASCIM|nr:hypothetical protein BJ508DRAFT_416901 [Ascobolus immersus RN42]
MYFHTFFIIITTFFALIVAAAAAPQHKYRYLDDDYLSSTHGQELQTLPQPDLAQLAAFDPTPPAFPSISHYIYDRNYRSLPEYRCRSNINNKPQRFYREPYRRFGRRHTYRSKCRYCKRIEF